MAPHGSYKICKVGGLGSVEQHTVALNFLYPINVMSILLRSYGYNSVLVFIFFEKWLDLRSHEFSFIVSGVSVLYPCTLILTIPSWIMFRGIDQRVHIFKLYANWIYPNSVEPLKQCASVGSLFLNECYVSL